MNFDIKWIILGIALVMYLLVIIFQEKKIWMTSVAALAVIVLGFLAQGGVLAGNVFEPLSGLAALAHHIFLELINWNILMIYVGSMIIANWKTYSQNKFREKLRQSPQHMVSIDRLSR